MPIQLPSTVRAQAISSIQQYAREELDQEMGSIAADGLLEFFLEELAPSIYNRAVVDVKERLQSALGQIDVDLHQTEFAYWERRR